MRVWSASHHGILAIFLNHVLKRYYSTAMWPLTEEMETGEDVVHNEVPGPSSSIKSKCGPSSATKVSACPSELVSSNES
ncbi:hypothetical protein OSTOST_15193 [Ostertagia ostertagi]